MIRRALACSLLAVAALAAPPATAKAAGPDSLGVYAEEVAGLPTAERAASLDAIAATGFGLVRSPLYWADVERAEGRYEFAAVDSFVADLARRGLSWLPVIVSAPPFRTSGREVDGDGRSYEPPVPADLGDFAALLVRRYGPGGAFWAAHPGLPARPVRSWQVWNEPNIPFFWRGGIDPAAYAALLRATSAAIHAADADAEVVAAGIPDTGVGMALSRFMDGFYAAGGAGSYDVLALHAYSNSPEGVLSLAASVRARMDAAGDAAPMWITEVGWATGGLRAALTTDETRQAQALDQTLVNLAAARDDLGLRGVALFKWRDTRPAAGERDLWPHHTGVLRADGSPKPALAMLAVTLLAIADRMAAPLARRPAAPTTPRARAACRSRRVFRVRLRLRRGERVRWALVHVAGRATRRVRVRKRYVRVDLRGLRAGSWGIGITARTRGGRRVTAARRVRTCAPPKRRI